MDRRSREVRHDSRLSDSGTSSALLYREIRIFLIRGAVEPIKSLVQTEAGLVEVANIQLANFFVNSPNFLLDVVIAATYEIGDGSNTHGNLQNTLQKLVSTIHAHHAAHIESHRQGGHPITVLNGGFHMRRHSPGHAPSLLHRAFQRYGGMSNHLSVDLHVYLILCLGLLRVCQAFGTVGTPRTSCMKV